MDWSGEILNKRKDGEIYPSHLGVSVITDSGGNVDHYFAISYDISIEYKYKNELEQQHNYLLQQSRMIQMGEMLSMIAHQWRQPLTAISASAIDLLMKISLKSFDLEKKEEQQECEEYFTNSLNNIGMLVNNLSTTVDDFRDFYKPNKESEDKLIYSPVVKSILIIHTLLDSEGVTVVENYNSEKIIKMYENEIVQVVLNILKNSQDNFKEKNILSPKIFITARDEDDSSILEISDNGGGIPEDIIDRIFDPYFSTKDKKNGTGLGLYMSKIIVEKHHKAKLSVENIKDGACFKIEFF